MNKIKVVVLDKTTLELLEDGKKGDQIDLKEITQVDLSYLESIIENGKDQVYLKKLENAKALFDAENKTKIISLENEIENTKNNLEKEYTIKLKELENQISILKAENDNAIKDVKHVEESKYKELENKYNMLIQNYKLELENSKNAVASNYEKQLSDKDKELITLKNELELNKIKDIQNLKDKYESELKVKDELILNLQRSKAALNVKQTGEDLEAWCDNEMTSYMQTGLFNCTWTKDNLVIKDENELKGSKADYIFNVYASNEHRDSELLASICLDMKDENPDSINKKTNADYYKTLDKNRIKKNCKYAVLVSNLEMDKPNVLPIFKVREYENMYVVRPGYMMVFLNMIASLTTRFSELILRKEKEDIEFKDKLEIEEEFNKIKETYLDKPLNTLKTNIQNIESQAEAISKAANKIIEECDKVNSKYIKEIEEKINKFEIQLNRKTKKL